MGQISVLRLLRHQYGITLIELAKAAGVSLQYVSDIELGKYNISKSNQLLMQRAFEKVITQRILQAQRLSEAYAGNRQRLLNLITEDDDEL